MERMIVTVTVMIVVKAHRQLIIWTEKVEIKRTLVKNYNPRVKT